MGVVTEGDDVTISFNLSCQTKKNFPARKRCRFFTLDLANLLDASTQNAKTSLRLTKHSIL
jgi:hypothetical protein